MQNFKTHCINYLAKQGYPNLTWENIIAIYDSFSDNPTPGLENEIDSLMAGNDSETEDFILQSLTKLRNFNKY